MSWFGSEFNVCVFADDTMVSDNYLSLQTKATCIIQKIGNWLKANKLSLNYNKTWHMIVTGKKEKYNFHIKSADMKYLKKSVSGI